MWGTLPRRVRQGGGHRFIPTHVGNTGRVGWHDRCYPVHPHACGEHAVSEWAHTYRMGSSPRMWGTRAEFLRPPAALRFIPTHVGNTRRCQLLPGVKSVHPHACGEHAPSTVSSQRNTGSSPRMWGTQQRRYAAGCPARFIPTHVGNTRTHGPGLSVPPVHPHACGEHTYRPTGGRVRFGSSPRMWGTQQSDRRFS